VGKRSFRLEILTPEKPFFIGDAVSLTVPVSDGMIGIEALREPLAAAVRDGKASFTLPDGERREFSVSRGMLDVKKTGVKILCEYASFPEDIDADRERELLREAEAQLRAKKSAADLAFSKLMIGRALNNLRIKKGTGGFDG
jgi:F-type H+-transporting ATPase subunit epsilon